jgi:hypothetical protein
MVFDASLHHASGQSPLEQEKEHDAGQNAQESRGAGHGGINVVLASREKKHFREEMTMSDIELAAVAAVRDLGLHCAVGE